MKQIHWTYILIPFKLFLPGDLLGIVQPSGAVGWFSHPNHCFAVNVFEYELWILVDTYSQAIVYRIVFYSILMVTTYVHWRLINTRNSEDRKRKKDWRDTEEKQYWRRTSKEIDWGKRIGTSRPTSSMLSCEIRLILTVVTEYHGIKAAQNAHLDCTPVNGKKS